MTKRLEAKGDEWEPLPQVLVEPIWRPLFMIGDLDPRVEENERL